MLRCQSTGAVVSKEDLRKGAVIGRKTSAALALKFNVCLKNVPAHPSPRKNYMAACVLQPIRPPMVKLTAGWLSPALRLIAAPRYTKPAPALLDSWVKEPERSITFGYKMVVGVSH